MNKLFLTIVLTLPVLIPIVQIKKYYIRHPYLTNSNSDASLNPLIYQGKLNAEKKKLYLRRRIPVSFLSSSAGSGEVCMSSDGKTIYFVSDKKNGYGQTDIYVSHQKIWEMGQSN